LRADRLGPKNEGLYVLCETSLETIFQHIEEMQPDLVVIDSIQTVQTETVESSAGSLAQIRECAAALLRYAKAGGTSILLIGHINKEGSIAGPKVLEPIYEVEVLVPGDLMGDVMSDINGRRGMVLGMEAEKNFQRLKALVPLAEMSSYSTTLSSLTGGRATFTMHFKSYELVPADVQEKLVKAYAESQKDED
jgi:hypothetical protein